MNLSVHYLTHNECYQKGVHMQPKGIMVHSVGAAQPNVDVFLKSWNSATLSPKRCVHAFVGADRVAQTLPWDMRGWHCGRSGNDTHIGFEICEPAGHTYGSGGSMIGYDTAKNNGYFNQVYNNSVALCAMLCEKYQLDPLAPGVLICHSEGYKLGIASNHADVMHWFPKHGKSMDTFRQDVQKKINAQIEPAAPESKLGFAIGDTVRFTGNRHYASSMSDNGLPCSGGNAKITAVAEGARHPYHLVRIAGGGSSVWGWVDSAYVSAAQDTRIYTVVKGDSLWRIAQSKLGHGARYTEIIALNGLKSDALRAGQILKLPAQ